MVDSQTRRIVIAEDDHDLCDLLKEILEKEGYAVDCVHDGFSLISFLKEEQDIDAIILDLIMPGREGTSIFNTVRSISPASKLIIYTGYSSFKRSIYAKEADAFFCKTDNPEKLIEKLRELL